MMKMLTAHTLEIDDVDVAVAEVLDGLDLDGSLLANSVGIINCYPEFLDTGVVEALAEKLPFDIVGTTTIGNAVPGEKGLMMLSLAVLTSDDIQFACGMSAPLGDAAAKSVADLYSEITGKLPGKPSLLLGYQPLLLTIGGDSVIGFVDDASGKVPYFGAVTVDHTDDYHDAYVIYNDQAERDCLALLALYGDVDPVFFVANISDEKVQRQKAVITASEGNLLEKVNDVSIKEYIDTLGVDISSSVGGVNTVPFVIDFGDGSKPVTRSIFAITPEGYAVGGGAMPEGATMSIGSVDYDDIIHTTTGTMEQILTSGRKQGVLLHSCIGRNLNLGTDTEAEMERIMERLGDKIPYQFSYVGGESCPVYTENGATVNRFHNVTLIGCAF